MRPVISDQRKKKVYTNIALQENKDFSLKKYMRESYLYLAPGGYCLPTRLRPE
jgi:hypothetical protein